MSIQDPTWRFQNQYNYKIAKEKYDSEIKIQQPSIPLPPYAIEIFQLKSSQRALG